MVDSQEDLKNGNKICAVYPLSLNPRKFGVKKSHSFLFFLEKETIIRCEVQRFERHVFAPSGEANTIVCFFHLDA